MPIQGIENQFIVRQNDDNTSSLCVHPFSELRELRFKSHIHPKFVIFDVGRKMESWEEDLTAKLMKDFPSLRMISFLYHAWSRDVPRTTNHTLLPVWNKMITKTTTIQTTVTTATMDSSLCHTNYGWKGYWSTETPNVVRRNPVRLRSVRNVLSEVNLNNSKLPSLSKGTLCSHNQQIGGVAWTVNRIRKWSALVGPLRKKRKLGPSL